MSYTNSENDWDHVTILHKSESTLRKQAKDKMSKGGLTDAQTRFGAGQNKQHIDDVNTRKLDENDDGGTHKKIPRETSQTIQRVRNEKGLKREQLAQKINIKSNLLAEYEEGKAIPNQQILNKLEHVLGVYLRGDKCGDELPKREEKKK